MHRKLKLRSYVKVENVTSMLWVVAYQNVYGM